MASSRALPSVLTLRLSRLPDLSSHKAVLKAGFKRYGRFAILHSGALWIADAISSHPRDTKTGWYWATTWEGLLLVSARGAAADGEALFKGNRAVLALLVGELVKTKAIDRPASIILDCGAADAL